MAKKRVRWLYTVKQLADMSGLTRKRMLRLLETNGVEFIMIGNRRHVALSELFEKLPSLDASARYATLVGRTQEGEGP